MKYFLLDFFRVAVSSLLSVREFLFVRWTCAGILSYPYALAGCLFSF